MKYATKFGYAREIISHYGMKSFSMGLFRRMSYCLLRKKYRFAAWHTSPIEFRPYALDVVDYINSNLSEHDLIIELGCGLGDILSRCKTANRIGIDIDQSVIEAAKAIHKEVTFNIGTFEMIKGFSMKYLLMLGFTHEIDEDQLSEMIQYLTEENEVECIIVDCVMDNNYKYNHDIHALKPPGYEDVFQLGKYKSDRFVYAIRRADTDGLHA